MTSLRRAVPPGWVTATVVGRDKRLLHYADESIRFEHQCKMLGPGEQLVCAPLLDFGHAVATDDLGNITVTPSVLCSDCETHGYVTGGVWRDC